VISEIYMIEKLEAIAPSRSAPVVVGLGSDATDGQHREKYEPFHEMLLKEGRV